MNKMTFVIPIALLMLGSLVEMSSARRVAAESPVSRTQADNEDSYIAGYAAAVLERDFHVPSGAVRVRIGSRSLIHCQISEASHGLRFKRTGRYWPLRLLYPRLEQRYSVTRQAWEPNWCRLVQPSSPTGISLASY